MLSTNQQMYTKVFTLESAKEDFGINGPNSSRAAACTNRSTISKSSKLSWKKARTAKSKTSAFSSSSTKTRSRSETRLAGFHPSSAKTRLKTQLKRPRMVTTKQNLTS